MGRKARESTAVTKIFADRLSELIQEEKEAGATHEQICKQAGVGAGAMSEWASDMKTANIESLVKISQYFDVSSDYLLGLTNARTNSIDIKTVCTTTGLGEKFVCNLTKVTQEEIKELNKFLSSRNLIDFLRNLVQYAWLTEKLRVAIQRNQEDLQRLKANMSDIDEIDRDYMLEDVEETYADVRYIRFELIDCFSKAFDEIYKVQQEDTAVKQLRERWEEANK